MISNLFKISSSSKIPSNRQHMDVQHILSASRLAQAVTGRTRVQFEALTQRFGPLWRKSLHRRVAEGDSRQILVGDGFKGQLAVHERAGRKFRHGKGLLDDGVIARSIARWHERCLGKS